MTVDGKVEGIAAEKLYHRAYEMHYTKRDYEGAVGLYREVIERFPKSKEAGYAATQIENIEGISPEEMAAEQERETQVVQEDHAAPAPKRNAGSVESRFGALRAVSGAFKALAFINAIGGGIAALMLFSSDGAVLGLPMLLVTAFSAVLCWALAEAVLVLLAIEENTRRAAVAFERTDN